MDAPVDGQGCANCVRLQKRVDELEALVVSLQQQVRALQARLDQDSSNSHKPPSSDPPWAGKKPPAKKPTGKPRGGQPGHKGHYRKRLPPQRVNHTVHYYPGHCRNCQSELPRERSAQDPQPAWHQVAELPPLAAIVTEHQAHARTCGCCGTVTRAAIPADVKKHVLGPRLSATLSYLAGRCHNGKRLVQEMLSDLFEVPLALGSISNYERQMNDALAASHQEAMAHVRKAPLKCVDETGWKEAGQRRWLWTAATGQVACFLIHRQRSREALAQLLGTRSRGIISSDRHPLYLALPLSRRQICWAHFKRECVKWEEHSPQTKPLGSEGLAICRKVFALWRRFRLGSLTRGQLQRRAGPLRRRLRQVLTWNQSNADRKAAEFCRRLLRIEPALWRFTRHNQLEPTNNHAERMLRLAVLWRKNSFGNASPRGCQFAQRMLTAIQTLRLQGRGVLHWLQQILRAHRRGLPVPALC